MLSLLIADDMPLITSMITRLIKAEKINFNHIIEVHNGIETVEKARVERPDVALIDIHMPGLTGLDAATLIREELPNTKIIFLTAYDEFSYIHQALKLGAIDYLLKPIRPLKLAEILKKVIDDIQPTKEKEIGTLFTEEPLQHCISIKRTAVNKAIDYIQEHYKRSDISLSDVAKAVHLSPSHLAHTIKEALGMSYKKYVTAQRINAAKQLLQTTDWTVEIVAEHVGYANVTNFYRLFQRETNLTPIAYRKRESHMETL